MANTNEYIVFEADQVLTNDNLNEMFSYLDQQNRWTRNKLIGIGIVCGFNLVHNTGVITITKGCGVTSQGYLIVKDKAAYAYMMPYAAPDMPVDLPFTYPGDLPFYKPFCTGKSIYLLLTDDEYDNLEENKKPSAVTLSSQKAGFLDDYAVVLFLEANETDLKNCTAFDCTNKGGKMQFNIRPLLVAKKDLPSAVKVKEISGGQMRFAEMEVEKEKVRLSHEITFKRYNVPYTPLRSSTAVLKAFVKIVDDATLHEVANAYMYCYEKYASLLNETGNPFSGLFNALKERRDAILKEYPIYIQYFYDFVDDLILAYYEFCTKVTGIISQCCPDENLFPLHLVLGDAAKDTTAFVHDAWRNYFIYSPLFTKGNSERNEAQFYFERMLLMAKDFFIVKATANQKNVPIKITPSQYGYLWLSQRAIPYYYRIVTGENAIYNYWNYYKSSHGNAVFNLSYNTNLYNHAKAAIQPLLYDIEHYNFFRIEGHIGEQYNAVLENILHQRLEYNLPFDVVAISADLLRSSAKLPVCNMQDLETDYKLIISEFACKVHTPFCFLTKLPYPPNAEQFTGDVKQMSGTDGFAAYRVKAMAHFNSVSEILYGNTYKVGDFMRKYCMPDDDKTVGGYYLASLDNTYNVYGSEQSSIHSTAEQNALGIIYDVIFAFINAVEQLMFVLMRSTVATLDIDVLKKRYEAYTNALTRLSLVLMELVGGTSLKLSAAAKLLEMDMLIDEFFILSTICIDERLQTLVEEYLRRLRLFQQQNTFLNYYRKHPGLEHKAGVPKGGTFVLVYYSAEEGDPLERGKTANNMLSADRITTGNAKQAPAEGAAVYEKIDTGEERILKTFIDNCKDASTDDRTKVIGIIDRIWQRQPVEQRFRFKAGEVIADFYVPYMCCSDCPPVAYILPEKKEGPPVVETPSLSMGTTFCDNDQSPKTITVSPAGGKITDSKGNEVKAVDNTAFTFNPAVAGAGVYDLIYTVSGESSPVKEVTVVAAPADNTFTVTSKFGEQGILTATFTPNATGAGLSYAWTFGTGFGSVISSADSIPKLPVTPTAGAVTDSYATLQVSNGGCSTAVNRVDLLITTQSVTVKNETKKDTEVVKTAPDKKIEIGSAPAAAKVEEKNKQAAKKKK